MNNSSMNRMLRLSLLWSMIQVSSGLISPQRISSRHLSIRLLAKQQRQSTETDAPIAEEERVEVVGSQFFGGNKEKEEFYDPVAEAEAAVSLETVGSDQEIEYNRFQDTRAFPDEEISSLACSLQLQINTVLYEDESEESATGFSYSPSLKWSSPWQPKTESSSPLDELEEALSFYRRCDVAIIGGERISETQIQLFWTISVAWPTFWEPKVVITGSSVLKLDGKTITEQVDMLDNEDLSGSISDQVVPRFWDAYHIGMTPSAEIIPRIPVKAGGLFTSYKVFELPPKLVLQPTMTDLGGREDNNAGFLPNHAFSCVVKTMGPKKQRYVPASPTQVRIQPTDGKLLLEWSIPITVEYLTKSVLSIPQSDEETDMRINPTCEYMYQNRRQVATVPYGGMPQDPEVSDIRRKLYESVTKDGLKPKLVDGKPVFFFQDNALKACYTDEGLGMAVYEYRAAFTKPHEIGIELEVPPGNRLAPNTK